MKNLCNEDKLQTVRAYAKDLGFSAKEISFGANISLATAISLINGTSSKHHPRIVNAVYDFFNQESLPDNEVPTTEMSCSERMALMEQIIQNKSSIIHLLEPQAKFCEGCPKQRGY